MREVVAKLFAVCGMAAVSVSVKPAMASGTGHASMLAARGAALVRAKSFAKAVVLYEDLAVVRPHAAGKVLGPLYAALGWNDRAFDFYSRMVKRYPNRPWYWYCLGYAARSLKRWPRAVAAYRRVLRLAPKDPSARYGLALSLMGMGRRKEAVALLEAYVSAEKRPWARAWVAKARLLLSSLGEKKPGRRGKAQRSALRVTARHPHRLGAWEDRTKALVAVAAVIRALKRGDMEGAERLGWVAVRRHPQFGEAYLALSKVLEKKGDWRRAMGILRLGLRRIELFGAGRVGIARLALEHGLRDEAMLNLSAFAMHPSDDTLLLSEAARLSEALGRADWRDSFAEHRKRLLRRKRAAPRLGRQGGTNRVGRKSAEGHGRSRGGRLDDLSLVVTRARRMIDGGRCRDAARLVEPAIRRHPIGYKLLVLSAEAILCAGGNTRMALRRALAACRAAPKRFSAWRVAGLAALRLRGRKAAKIYLLRYLELAKNVPSQRSRVAFVKALVQNLQRAQ